MFVLGNFPAEFLKQKAVPPVGLAFPVAYIAMSPATTRAYRPERYNSKVIKIPETYVIK